MKDKVLIVEDELIVARHIRRTLEQNGFKVAGVARTAEKAIDMIGEFEPSLVLLDIFLKGDQTGIDVAIYLNKKSIPFIYISANSNQPILEAAKTTDPYGFIVKPFREKDLLVTIDIASYRYDNKMKMLAVNSPSNETKQGLASEIKTSVLQRSKHPVCENIIGRSSAMLHVFNLIQQVAPFDTSVLILGESGTGKEGVAACIVQQSNRSSKPFVKINCAAIPSELMESEFFGYEKGAFTGATDRRPGKFELANGGTVLLDEIGEMPPELQAKLLRVLQEKEIQRIGSSSIIKVDIRILAATSRNLEREVAEKRFRLDLYYRLRVFPINIPPLRDRQDDIPILIDHFIRHYSQKLRKNVQALAPTVLQQMREYHWPGNIRELQHLIERTVLINDGEIIKEIDLPDTQILPEKGISKSSGPNYVNERDHILTVLRLCNFKITGNGGAAEILNLSPSALQLKIKNLGIKKGYE